MSSNLIKRPAGAPVPRRRNLFKRLVVETEAEARRIREAAESKAAAVRKRAAADARQLRKEAYDTGYDEATQKVTEHLLEALARRDTALVRVERDVLRLAVKIAEKIIGREIERDEETLAHIVASALHYARRHENITVRLNAADMPLVQAREEFLQRVTRTSYLDFVTDPSVGRGGCVIESDIGAIDARLETQLRVIERALLSRSEDNMR